MDPEVPAVPTRLIDAPTSATASAAATLLLAHGAGAPMDSLFQAAIAAGLAERGWRVVRFEFPYMARTRITGRRHGPDRMPVLQEAFREQVRRERSEQPDHPLLLAGKSMGGRVASLVLDELAASAGVLGCLCLGYPFHPPGKPGQLRTEHLAALQTPALILQGERDSFGRREEVETYTLSPQVQLQWIPSGDHSFRPTRSSGRSEEQNLALAVELSDAFLRQRLTG
ncbi:MAG: alpha/beta family hydrolase [Prochlorococcaceae cyanobacterium]|jgi:predicted alpha/beta-hydrolase family hydrolase